MIRILMGGSPCTHWSIAQSKNRETEPSGIGWELFKNFLIAKEKYKPDFFLYENNKSAAQPIKDQISRELGQPLQYINSALVSAQNRQRFYCHNIPGVPLPEDRGILLRDILETGTAWKEKGYTLDANYFKTSGIGLDTQAGRRKMAAEPVNVTADGKAYAIKAQYSRSSNACYFNGGGHFPSSAVAEPVAGRIVGRRINQDGKRDDYNSEIELFQRFEVNEKPQKTNCISTVQKDNVIAEPMRIGTIESDAKNKSFDSQQYRVYSPDGKSVTLCGQGGGVGAKTGLYAAPAGIAWRGHSAHGNSSSFEMRGDGKSNAVIVGHQSRLVVEDAAIFQRSHGFNAGGIKYEKSPTLTANGSFEQNNFVIQWQDGKTYPIYEVRNGIISIKGQQYPIKLADGYYIIRKLTVLECKRLQTVPDNYIFPVSNTQAYKMLGNGWTVDVIAHILSHIPGIRNEPIEVLSMYDGMSCGHIALDKIGANVIRYYATEIDKYAIKTTMANYPDTIQLGDAYQVREDGWHLPE